MINFIKKFWVWISALLIPVAFAAPPQFIDIPQPSPYIEFQDRFDLPIKNDVEQAGVSKVRIVKNQPKVIFDRWNGEVQMGVSLKSNLLGSATRFGAAVTDTNKIKWVSPKKEVHAYPIDDKNFEFEIVLNEKPLTNAFEFLIEGAENLDFFYQPELTQAEIDEGSSRPDNVIGSYAVYHKTAKNHRTGNTNYATGKAYHIYRPKVIDANGVEEWAVLEYQNGVLNVTVPQRFLDGAVYPVRVDPTFGYTTAGASTTSSFANASRLSHNTATEDGTVTKISHYVAMTSTASNIKGVIWGPYVQSSSPVITNGVTDPVSVDNSVADWKDSTYSSTPTITDGTDYLIGDVHESSTKFNNYFDVDVSNSGGTDGNTGYTSPGAITNPSNTTRRYSIYATYTATGGGAAPPTDDTYFQILEQ